MRISHKPSSQSTEGRRVLVRYADKLPPATCSVLKYPCDECEGPRGYGFGYQCHRCGMFLCHKCAGEEHELLRHGMDMELSSKMRRVICKKPKFSAYRLRVRKVVA